MNCPDYNSPQALKKILDDNGMAMQKKFGQNFMTAASAREKIVSFLELTSSDTVWEIGPGLGAMTSAILASGASMTAFEVDRGFIAQLHCFFKDEEQKGRFGIVEGDVLKNWKNQMQIAGGNVGGIKLFGNLPYNIAATFIADTITAGAVFNRCVFTVQREVADRMRAQPGSKDYSSFSVLCQWIYDVKAVQELAPGCFWPRPNVASETVVFTPKAVVEECSDKKHFVTVVHALFSQRRKTLLNNIKPILPAGVSADDVFAKAGISKSERAENLSVADFSAISRAF